RAAAAIGQGLFDAEIVPVTVASRTGDTVVTRDEHPRETSLEKLAALRPAFRKNGSVTAGNSSGINDGAAALVLARESTADRRGLPKLGELVAFAKTGLEPEIMGYAPVNAIRRVLDKAGLQLADI